MERNVRLIVSGYVQSVGYRMFIHTAAVELGLSGWVRNLMDGSVEIEVQGSPGMIDELVKR
ncbi:MAG: acylphosphatase, partial [Chlorobiaceae bacterium]|nr:acylphosphatase [Chlorobiaceae bacterium]